MSRFIFVTGGVISGLGKGVAAASIGNILKSAGYSIFVLKLDPYLNVDPGVMSPYEHGEVYVTEDGGETDLDLGHYERFIDINVTKDSNYTSGKIFQNILEKERQGKYNGKTVQFIPHVTNEIKQIILNVEKKHKPDFMIIEIGGTVGDLESNPFMVAVSELSAMKPKIELMLIHTTYVPFLNTSKDFKTKPTQNSVQLLNSLGLKADVILLRSDKDIPNDIIEKLANKVLLPKKNIISMPDLSSVYGVPVWLSERKISEIVQKHFNLKVKKPKLNKWNEFLDKVKAKKETEIKIAMVGKYVEFLDAYKSIIEALEISAIYNNVKINFKWLEASKMDFKKFDKIFSDIDGIVILPGFGARGFEAKVNTAIYSRKHDIPTFGICLGMQAMSVAQARIKGYENANSAEFVDEEKPSDFLVLDIIRGKSKNDSIGGTLRLGNQEVEFLENSLFAKYYGSTKVLERHRHRYEITEQSKNILPDKEFIFSGINPVNNLVESCEVKNKKFYLGTQYHPEFTARPLKPHKIFSKFIEIVKKEKNINAKK